MKFEQSCDWPGCHLPGQGYPLDPELLDALTRTKYFWPSLSPVIVQSSAPLVVQVAAAGRRLGCVSGDARTTIRSRRCPRNCRSLFDREGDNTRGLAGSARLRLLWRRRGQSSPWLTLRR